MTLHLIVGDATKIFHQDEDIVELKGPFSFFYGNHLQIEEEAMVTLMPLFPGCHLNKHFSSHFHFVYLCYLNLSFFHEFIILGQPQSLILSFLIIQSFN